MFKIIETLILNENTPTQNSFPGPKFYRDSKETGSWSWYLFT